MHVQEFSLNQASLLSDGVFSVDPSENTPPLILPSYPTHRTESSSVLKTLQRILNRLSRMELPGADQLEAYLRHVARRNRRPRTLCSLSTSVMLFLGMLRDGGRRELGSITRADVEAFIEREQDRGIKITTIRTRLVCVCAFLRYLAEEKVVSAEIFVRRIRLQLPERLPRAMDPEDLAKLLSVIDDTQDRAMILVLAEDGDADRRAAANKDHGCSRQRAPHRDLRGGEEPVGKGRVPQRRCAFGFGELDARAKRPEGVPVLRPRPRKPDVLQHGPRPVHALYRASGAGSSGLHGPHASPYLCHRAAQCRDAPGVPAGAAGALVHRRDAALCPAHRQDARGRVLQGHVCNREGKRR